MNLLKPYFPPEESTPIPWCSTQQARNSTGVHLPYVSVETEPKNQFTRNPYAFKLHTDAAKQGILRNASQSSHITPMEIAIKQNHQSMLHTGATYVQWRPTQEI
jgi:hypothetical protein